MKRLNKFAICVMCNSPESYRFNLQFKLTLLMSGLNAMFKALHGACGDYFKISHRETLKIKRKDGQICTFIQ